MAEARAAMAKGFAAVIVYDLKLTALLLVLWPLAWLVPPRQFDALAGRLVRLLAQFYRSDRQFLKERMAAVAGDRIEPARRALIVATQRRLLLRDAMLVLRANRPGADRPAVGFEGLDNLQSAIDRDRGVILWDGYFAQHEIVIASGISAAGCRPCVVRVETHGFSSSAFGVRVLNPIHRRAVERYCDYIVLDDKPAAGIRAI